MLSGVAGIVVLSGLTTKRHDKQSTVAVWTTKSPLTLENKLSNVDEVLRDIINLSIGASEEAHDYLPKTEEEVYAFQPHGWVENAIRLAFLFGLNKALYLDVKTTPEKVASAALEVTLGGNLKDEKNLAAWLQ